MALLFVHRILIIAAIALGAILLLYGVFQYSSQGDLIALLTGIAGSVMGVGLSFYLRWFLQKQRRASLKEG